MRRRGFSLIEVAVFTAVGLVVVSGVWSLFGSSIRKGKATESKVQGLQATLLFARAWEADMANLFEGQGYQPSYRKVVGTGFSFSFFRYHPNAGKNPGTTWGPVPLQKVTYEFIAKEKRILRGVDDGPGRPLFGYFETFGVRRADDEEPVPGAPLPPGAAFVYYVVSTPPEVLKMDLEQRDKERPRSRTTLFGASPRHRAAADQLYPYWNQVPYEPEPATPVL